MQRRLGGLAVLVVFLTAAACGDGSTSDDGRARVVAGFYPVAEIARRTGGHRVEVVNLTPPGAEPHDLELTPRQVDRLEDADLVLYLGGFQPAVERVLRRSGNRSVDLRAGLGHGDDPHLWLDPTLMTGMVTRVEQALSDVDPAGRDDYAANAENLRRELAALDRELAAGLADCRHRVIVTAHAAFGYLAERYGLTQEAVTGLSPEEEPDPRRLAQLVDLVRSTGVNTVFTETLLSPDIAETLARETGVSTAVLNPLEGLTAEEAAAGADYFSVMRDNLSVLRRALECR